MLRVSVVRARVDFVPRDVRVPEHHRVGVRKPFPQSCGSSSRGTAVVHKGDLATVDVDGQSLGYPEADVVVAEHGMHGRVFTQCAEHGHVRDVAGVQDDIGDLQLWADAVGQSRRLPGAEMGVGEEQHTRRHRRSVSASGELDGGRLDGFDDLGVSGAPAEVP